MSMAVTPLEPGQQFRQFDGRDRDEVVTVVRLDCDAMGLSRVVFAAPGGREVCAYTAQVAAAVATGELMPADDRQALSYFLVETDEKLAS